MQHLELRMKCLSFSQVPYKLQMGGPRPRADCQRVGVGAAGRKRAGLAPERKETRLPLVLLQPSRGRARLRVGRIGGTGSVPRRFPFKRSRLSPAHYGERRGPRREALPRLLPAHFLVLVLEQVTLMAEVASG